MNRAAGAVSLALVLLASGCGDDGGASPTLPPLTVTPSASIAPTASAPNTASPLMRAFPDTPQGASAFARFLYSELDRAYREKDPEIVRPYFDQACKSCARYLSTLSQLQSGAVSVQRSSPATIAAASPGGSGPRLVFLRQKKAEVIFKDSTGKVIAREPAGEYSFRLTLRRSEKSYVLVSQLVSKS